MSVEQAERKTPVEPIDEIPARHCGNQRLQLRLRAIEKHADGARLHRDGGHKLILGHGQNAAGDFAYLLCVQDGKREICRVQPGDQLTPRIESESSVHVCGSQLSAARRALVSSNELSRQRVGVLQIAEQLLGF
jgi:hypothetical protein